MKNAAEFLKRYGMEPEAIDPAAQAAAMAEDMRRGLTGEKADMMMIPTYLSVDGELTEGSRVAVIDAGGTNFRCANAEYTGGKCVISGKKQMKMPGIEKPATWEEFISFTADQLEPLMDGIRKIGYCFSYSAEITPEIDGCVRTIDKEVTVTGASGKLVGASLCAELQKRGFPVEKTVIINDTVACLLGGMADVDRSRFSGFIGQISGTGTNTCCIVPAEKITKLGTPFSGKMIVNMESGFYTGLPRGEIDRIMDAASAVPGEKLFEKMTGGVYLGELASKLLQKAAEDQEISAEADAYVKSLGHFDTATVDAWSNGIFKTEQELAESDRNFLQEISVALLQRSARCMSTNLLGIGLLTGEGRDPERPICDCAEGSLVQKSEVYRAALKECLAVYGAQKLGIYITLNVCDGTTLPGAGAAAMLS